MGVNFPADKPEPDEVEVSLIGGGNGYGESLVIHLGEDQWIIVDSLQDPKNKQNLPLAYLNGLGVDTQHSVKMVVATHWHDDHVVGLNQVVQTCPNAKFVCTGALAKSQFLTLISLGKHVSNPKKSGVSEFSQILNHLKSNGQTITKAIEDRLLFDYIYSDGTKCEVWALSPSDSTIDKFDQQLGQLIDQAKVNLQIGAAFSNHVSVVLLLKLGSTSILLGADLENTPDKNQGWDAVLATSACPKDHSVSLFKIPHHGSENGDHPDIWKQVLIQSNPWVGLTPFARGRKKLPAPADVVRILGYTKEASLTANPNQLDREGGKKRSPRIRRAIQDTGLKIREIRFFYGHLRFRLTPSKIHWKLDRFGEAIPLQTLPTSSD